jgi:hypothetical protein
VNVRFPDEIVSDHNNRHPHVDSSPILFDSPSGASERISTNRPTILVEQRSRSLCATFFARSRKFAFEASIVTQSANHGAEKHRGRCGAC